MGRGCRGRTSVPDEIGQRDGYGGFDDHGPAQGDADIVAAADRERLDLVRRQVVGILFAPDARGRLDRRAYHDLVGGREKAEETEGGEGRGGGGGATNLLYIWGGFVKTIEISALSIFFSLIFGTVLALVKSYAPRPFRILVRAYI